MNPSIPGLALPEPSTGNATYPPTIRVLKLHGRSDDIPRTLICGG